MEGQRYRERGKRKGRRERAREGVKGKGGERVGGREKEKVMD